MTQKDQCGQTPQPDQGQPALGRCERQSAKLVLQDILFRLQRKQSNIETLLAMLPSKMTPEQDEAMWQLACELERR